MSYLQTRSNPLTLHRGQIEGQATRLKLIKRQGYGRAKFDLQGEANKIIDDKLAELLCSHREATIGQPGESDRTLTLRL